MFSYSALVVVSNRKSSTKLKLLSDILDQYSSHCQNTSCTYPLFRRLLERRVLQAAILNVVTATMVKCSTTHAHWVKLLAKYIIIIYALGTAYINCLNQSRSKQPFQIDSEANSPSLRGRNKRSVPTFVFPVISYYSAMEMVHFILQKEGEHYTENKRGLTVHHTPASTKTKLTQQRFIFFASKEVYDE